MKDDDEPKLIFYIIDENINFEYIYYHVKNQKDPLARFTPSDEWRGSLGLYSHKGRLATGPVKVASDLIFSRVTRTFSGRVSLTKKIERNKKYRIITVEKWLQHPADASAIFPP